MHALVSLPSGSLNDHEEAGEREDGGAVREGRVGEAVLLPADVGEAEGLVLMHCRQHRAQHRPRHPVPHRILPSELLHEHLS
jgi:hypothetical protein